MIFFSSSFHTLHWLRHRQQFPALIVSLLNQTGGLFRFTGIIQGYVDDWQRLEKKRGFVGLVAHCQCSFGKDVAVYLPAAGHPDQGGTLKRDVG